MLILAVIAAVGVGLVYLMMCAGAGCCGNKCSGDCNQGRNCDCDDKE